MNALQTTLMTRIKDINMRDKSNWYFNKFSLLIVGTTNEILRFDVRVKRIRQFPKLPGTNQMMVQSKTPATICNRLGRHINFPAGYPPALTLHALPPTLYINNCHRARGSCDVRCWCCFFFSFFRTWLVLWRVQAGNWISFINLLQERFMFFHIHNISICFGLVSQLLEDLQQGVGSFLHCAPDTLLRILI